MKTPWLSFAEAAEYLRLTTRDGALDVRALRRHLKRAGVVPRRRGSRFEVHVDDVKGLPQPRMPSRILPKVRCPRCQGQRTRVRFTRYNAQRKVVCRHRLCLAPVCGLRFRTEAPATTEQVARIDGGGPP